MKLSLNRILLYIIGAIVVVIAAGTVVAFGFKKAVPGTGLRRTDPVPESTKQYDAFTDLGELRLVSKADASETSGCTLVVTPWFAYNPGDKALFEELSRKKLKFRSIFINYCSQYTKKELISHGETAIKDDLRKLINEELVLGKIKAVYFDEYIFLE